MEREAQGLLAESKRLMEEARSLDPSAGVSTIPAIESKPVKARKPRAKVSA